MPHNVIPFGYTVKFNESRKPTFGRLKTELFLKTNVGIGVLPDAFRLLGHHLGVPPLQPSKYL